MNKKFPMSMRAGLMACLVIGLVIPLAAQESEHICFLSVAKAFDSGHGERKTYVISNRADWEELWGKVIFGANPGAALPEIDFTRRTLIAVFQGSQSSGGFEVTITDIVKGESNVKVVVKEILNLHCPAPGVITEPFHIVEIEKLDPALVEFKIKQRIRKCS